MSKRKKRDWSIPIPGLTMLSVGGSVDGNKLLIVGGITGGLAGLACLLGSKR